MPFVFNEVELCVVTINEKPWTCVREVYRTLEYGKATKAADIVKHLCSRENYAQQKCQDTITHLKTRHVPHARNPGKDNIIIIVRKHTAPANDKFNDLPYYLRGYNDVKGTLS